MAQGERQHGSIPNRVYAAEFFRLQAELVRAQEWVKLEGKRVVVIFEGRDAAGKGGTIKRITGYLGPRNTRRAFMAHVAAHEMEPGRSDVALAVLT